MKRKRVVILAVLAVAVPVGIYLQRLGFADDDAHERVQEHLWRLKQIDSTFDEDLLRARFSLLGNYDTFQHQLDEMEQRARAIAAAPGFTSEAGRTDVARAADEFIQVLRQRRQLFERFKSHNAVLANSRRYFPVAVKEISKQLDPAADRALFELLQELKLTLLSKATANEPIPPEAQAIPDRLRSWVSQHPQHPQVALLESFIPHARQLLAGEAELDRLLRELLALPTTTDIDRLTDIAEADLVRSMQRGQRSRILLYVLCAILGAITVYTLLALRAANRTLEKRVAERTSALTEASGLLEAMLENSPDFIYFKDRESHFVRFSKAFLQRFKLESADQLRGKSDADLFAPEHANVALHDEQEIIRTGLPIVGKLEKETHPDGHETWALTAKMPWRNGAGEIVGTFGISKDVTALKEVEGKLSYERDQLRALLNSSPDSIYFKDRASRFALISRSKAEKMLARVPGLRERLAGPDADPATPVAPERFVGLSDADAYLDDHASETQAEEREIMRTGQPVIGKTERQVYRDGTVSWSITNKMPWRDKDGHVIGTFGLSKDITALKQAEEKLEQVHRQLLEASRAAGMAEVATGVLHNVGNVLNSVNVSATLVADAARRSKTANVGKLSALLAGHQDDLASFLAHDPRGKMILPYLATLASELTKEQEAMLAELDQLRKNVDHIKDIVAMQQSYAKTSGLTEAMSVPDLIEDAVRMNAGSLARHDVDVIRDYQVRPVVVLDKHKVLQILVNLIRNAKYACDETGRSDKQIKLRLATDEQTVQIAVADNGVGIPAENLTRIFNHGFTTRGTQGHGFGLHSCALAAKEMGGTLLPYSDGPGRGATFVLTLPLKPESSTP
ncbi:MAG: PAS domain S-box protein [Opitutae bacterium]|nr:PAS domain S-box protein [Opitutae bacterium]